MVVSLWDEVQGANFGDKRLNRRLGLIVEELGAQPNQSIPAATDSRAEMEAAYRFFDTDKVSPEKILQSHFDLCRECPDLNCEVVFEPCEWKAVYMAIKKKEPPKTPPRLNDVIRMIASLGGYVIRKSTQPGPQTLWIGLQRTHDMSTAWNAFGPDS